MPEFYVIFAPKNYQNYGIFMIFARKINKIPELYMIIACKIFSRFLFLEGGHVLPFLPSPTPML